MNKLLLAAFALLSLPASAQLTTITASSITMGNNRLQTGVVNFTPESYNGIPIVITAGGGGLYGPQPISCAISQGSIVAGCQVPDTAQANPADTRYQIQVLDTIAGQSITIRNVQGVAGATWALDQYVPPAANTASSTFQASSGAGMPPSRCNAPAFYTQTSNGGILYQCVNGAFVVVSGGSGGGSGAPLTANAINSALGYTAASSSDSRLMNALQTTGGTLTGAISAPAPTQPAHLANKSYVDTKAVPFNGGTVQNPIVLPSDPTDSLQAATKQYVDSHAGSGGSGNIAATTSLLKGTSSGGSAIQATPADVAALTGINADGVHAATTTLPINQTAINNRFEVTNGSKVFTNGSADCIESQSYVAGGYGTGWCRGISQYTYAQGVNNGSAQTPAYQTTAGWAVSQTMDLFSDFHQPGISQTIGANTNCMKVGDCAFIYDYLSAFGGQYDSANEGVTDMVLNGNQTRLVFAGTLTAAGTGATSVTVNCGGVCSQAAGGGTLIDTTTPLVSGFLSGEDPVAHNVTTSVALTPPTALGSLAADISVPVNGNTGTQRTITVTKSSGTFTSGVLTTMWCDDFMGPEKLLNPTITTSGNTVSITANVRYSHVAASCPVVTQGGTHGALDLTADQRTPQDGSLMRTAYPAVAIAANTLHYVNILGGSSRALYVLAHVLDGGANSGFNLWSMAEVVQVGMSSYVDSVTGKTVVNPNGQITLMPNNVAWKVGDTVEEPPPTSYAGAMMNLYGTFNNPPVDSGAHSVAFDNKGVGVSGIFTAQVINNSNPFAMYSRYTNPPASGLNPLLTPPDAALFVKGAWQSIFDTFQPAPGTGDVIHVRSLTGGFTPAQSYYNLVHLETNGGPCDYIDRFDMNASSHTFGFCFPSVQTDAGWNLHGSLSFGDQNNTSLAMNGKASSIVLQNDGQAGQITAGDSYGINTAGLYFAGRAPGAGAPPAGDQVNTAAATMYASFSSGDGTYPYLHFKHCNVNTSSPTDPSCKESFFVGNDHYVTANYGFRSTAITSPGYAYFDANGVLSSTGTAPGSGSGTATGGPFDCQEGFGDFVNVLPSAPYKFTCLNTTGKTVMLSAVRAFSDNNGNSTVSVTNSSGTVLIPAFTATPTYANGTISTTTLAAGDWLVVTLNSDGSPKSLSAAVTGSFQ